MATFARMARIAVVDELSKDYVRAGRARGLSLNAVVVRHVLRNALVSVGGLIALAATAGVLAWLEGADLIPYLQVDLNLAVFGWGMLIATVFGLLSGVLPAWKMSRLDPVHALKGAL